MCILPKVDNDSELFVERHQIRCSDPRFVELDHYCFLAKNLYNAANYECRARYIDGRNLMSTDHKPVKLLSYGALCRIMLNHPDFKALPCCVSQQVLRLLCGNWHTYFSTIVDARANPEKYDAPPKPPGYLNKKHGRFPIFYTSQGVLKRGLKGSTAARSPVRGVGIPVLLCETAVPYPDIEQVRILPRTKYNSIYVEVVYKRKEQKHDLNPEWCAGIDLGVTILAAVASNKPGFTPRIVNGGPLKSVNQYYNKRLARLQSLAAPTAIERQGRVFTNAMRTLNRNRYHQIQDYMHKASTMIVNDLVRERVGTIVVGHTKGWKQGSNIGHVNNQNFVYIPHLRFLNMLRYKSEAAGIIFVETEESFTSVASFLDQDQMAEEIEFSGRRRYRGLYISRKYGRAHADVNAAYNMIRKVIPNAFSKGIVGVAVHPVRIRPYQRAA